MSRRKDIWLILSVLAVALILFLVSRLMPKKTLEERTADVTLAPDAIEYVDETASPAESEEPQTPAPEQTPVPESTVAPETTSVPETTNEAEPTSVLEATAEPDATAKAEPASEPEATAKSEETAEAEVTSEPEATAKPEQTAEAEAASTPEAATEPEATAETEATSVPAAKTESEIKEAEATSAPEAKKGAAGPAFGPVLQVSDEPVKGHVVVMVGGRQYGDPIPMDRDKIITIRQDGGKINRIHITRDQVYMESSTCENQDCVGEGEITLENYRTRILGTYIICLPNEITVELIPADTAEAGQ